MNREELAQSTVSRIRRAFDVSTWIHRSGPWSTCPDFVERWFAELTNRHMCRGFRKTVHASEQICGFGTPDEIADGGGGAEVGMAEGLLDREEFDALLLEQGVVECLR
ncbi:hypothetical protein [Streptomyces sp. NPDC023327]|uniref:hypothetical protein n=1 Tax=Streptomyces sp. NPDC023327 TaxID=3157088 RepID=UPI0033F46953